MTFISQSFYTLCLYEWLVFREYRRRLNREEVCEDFSRDLSCELIWSRLQITRDRSQGSKNAHLWNFVIKYLSYDS